MMQYETSVSSKYVYTINTMKPSIIVLFMISSLVIVSHQEEHNTQNCIDPKNTYAFDRWDNEVHIGILKYLEEETQPSGKMLTCKFGMDVITLKNFIENINEGLKDELHSIHQGQQHPCWKRGCEHLTSVYNRRINENTFILDAIEDTIKIDNQYRSLHLRHPVFDMLEILQISQYNALVNIITELEYNRLKHKIDNDDLDDMPEVQLLLKKLY